jgi:hypothetical protein
MDFKQQIRQGTMNGNIECPYCQKNPGECSCRCDEFYYFIVKPFPNGRFAFISYNGAIIRTNDLSDPQWTQVLEADSGGLKVKDLIKRGEFKIAKYRFDGYESLE